MNHSIPAIIATVPPRCQARHCPASSELLPCPLVQAAGTQHDAGLAVAKRPCDDGQKPPAVPVTRRTVASFLVAFGRVTAGPASPGRSVTLCHAAQGE